MILNWFCGCGELRSTVQKYEELFIVAQDECRLNFWFFFLPLFELRAQKAYLMGEPCVYYVNVERDADRVSREAASLTLSQTGPGHDTEVPPPV